MEGKPQLSISETRMKIKFWNSFENFGKSRIEYSPLHMEGSSLWKEKLQLRVFRIPHNFVKYSEV
jgi:hypothetical protein